MKFSRWLILLAVLTLLSMWWIFIRVGIDPDKERTYSLLITKEHPFSLKDFFSEGQPKVISTWILFYRYPKGEAFLFEIDDATMAKVGEGFYRPINSERSLLKQELKEYYGLDGFDYEIRFTEEKQLDFLSQFGGSSFFNLHSTYLPLGEVYISDLNYLDFLDGIESPYLKKATALGFWYNLFLSYPEVLPHRQYVDNFLAGVYGLFSGNLNYPTFLAMLTPLIYPEDSGNNSYFLFKDRVVLKMDKNSIENISSQERPTLAPFQEGEYDRAKLAKELLRLSNSEIIGGQNITAQIKNATLVPRLAARAAGFFRLRGINIIEYLGFSEQLKHSVILDFSHDSRRRNYVREITRIDRFYYLFTYRESYDFGIYLGEDIEEMFSKKKSAEKE